MGRPRGSTNKNRRQLRDLLKAEHGEDFDVIMMMAENCITLHDIAKRHRDGGVTIDPDVKAGNLVMLDAAGSAKMAIDSLEKLAQYVEPKLKAVEMDALHDVTDEFKEFLSSIDGQDTDLPDGD